MVRAERQRIPGMSDMVVSPSTLDPEANSMPGCRTCFPKAQRRAQHSRPGARSGWMRTGPADSRLFRRVAPRAANLVPADQPAPAEQSAAVVVRPL